MKKRSVIFIFAVISAIALIITFSALPVSSCQNTSNTTLMKTVNLPNEEISLPAPRLVGTMSVEEALQKRRSIRSFQDKFMSMEDVSQLLWSAYGISCTRRGFKTAPSAGATYPLEVYLLAGKVEGLKPGLYRYIPANHSLRFVIEGDLRLEVSKASLGQRMLAEAPISIIYTAVFERTTARYGKRGEERYVCMDLGHSAQNVYLQATAMGMGTCAVGAFDDARLDKILQLPEEERILYLMPVGIKR